MQLKDSIIKKPANLKSTESSDNNDKEKEKDEGDNDIHDDEKEVNNTKEDNDENGKKNDLEKEVNESDTEDDSIIEENNIVYILSKKNQNAEIFQSQDGKKEIEIPKFIEHKSKIYKIVQIGSESFLNSTIELFKMITDENITISQKSFENCGSLKSIIIETTETILIEDNNFNKIPKLELVNIKGKLIFFGKNCFNECFTQQQCLPIQGNQPKGKIIRIEGTNNVSISNSCFKKLDLLEQIELNSNQIIVGDECFDECRTLSSFIFSKSKELILGSKQFRKCSNFQSIKLNSVNIELKTQCFSLSNLTKVEIFCEEIIIDKFCFSDLTTITEFSINNLNNVIIEENAFAGCHNLKFFSVVSEKSLSINNSSFINLKSLQKIYIKCPAIFIDESCFMNCKSLSSIEFINVIEYVISDKAFSHCISLKELSISSHKKAQIKKHCFSDCKNLSSIKFGSEEIMIDEFCFENCSSLSFSTFSKVNVLDIKSNCFKNCVNLENVSIEKSLVVHFGSFCFFRTLKLSSIVINTDQLITDENSFYQCESLQTLIFDKVKNAVFLPNSFKECSNLQNILIKNAHSLNFGEKCFAGNKNISYIEIQSEIIKLGKFIDSCHHLTKIQLNTIGNIEITQDTFPECSSLSYIEINSENSIYMAKKCFSNLKTIEQIKIKSNEVNIDNECFSLATNLRYITIDCSELKIGEESFKCCFNISAISLNNIRNAIIGSREFYGFNKLQSIAIQAQSKVTLGDLCFFGSSNLEYITIDSKVVEIFNQCFKKCNNLKSFIFKNVQNAFIGSNAFDQNQKLKNIDVSASSNIKLNESCFCGANGLDSIVLRSKEITIGRFCFKNCKNLSNIQLFGADNSTIGYMAFFGCESLQNIKMAVKSNLKIFSFCFSGANNLKNVELASKYLMIEDFIFKDCPSIISATFKSSSGSQLSEKAFHKSSETLKPDVTGLTK